MKKNLLILLVAFFSLHNIVADESPVFQWAAYSNSESSMTTTPGVVKKNMDNDVFVFGNFSSKESTLTAHYQWVSSTGNTQDVETPAGAPNTATSSNSNLYLYKLNKNGSFQWQVTSSMGDVATGNSAVTPTKDGGAFLALKVRHTNRNENGNNILLRLVDNKGSVTDVNWEYPDLWAYQGVFVKIDNEGKIEWTKIIPVNIDPIQVDGKSKDVPDGFSFYDLAEDENGNLYLGGTYVKPITFGTEVFSPHNAEGWNGDTQISTGDLFLVKLSASGSHIWNLRTSGQTTFESVKSICYSKGYLYLLGNLTGDGSDRISLGSYSMTPTDKVDAFITKVSVQDASVVWAKHFIGLPSDAAQGGRLKIASIDADDSSVYACGSFTGHIASASGDKLLTNTTTQGKTLRGFIIGLDATAGPYQSGVETIVTPTGISEISQTFVYGQKVQAVGYDMSAGMVLVSFGLDLTAMSAPFYLLKGSTPTSYTATLVDNLLIAFGRTRGAVTFTGTTETKNLTAFSGVLSAYLLPKMHTATDVTETQDILRAFSVASGELTLFCSEQQEVSVYTVYGVNIFRQVVAPGTTTLSLPKGIYIVNEKKVMVR